MEKLNTKYGYDFIKISLGYLKDESIRNILLRISLTIKGVPEIHSNSRIENK